MTKTADLYFVPIDNYPQCESVGELMDHPVEAMAAKYRLSKVHYDGFSNKRVRPKLTDFLIDERKRQQKQLANAGPMPINEHDQF